MPMCLVADPDRKLIGIHYIVYGRLEQLLVTSRLCLWSPLLNVDAALPLCYSLDLPTKIFARRFTPGYCQLMSTNLDTIESSSDAVVSAELPSNSHVALSNEVNVAVEVGDELLESNTGTLTTKPSSDHDRGGTVAHDSVNDSRVSRDERENVEKDLDEKAEEEVNHEEKEEEQVNHEEKEEEEEEEVNDEEKEGEYKVSDLVWAKVRNYPWWPGQIFDPSSSTDVARKYSKKKGFLIAYFGDQSFAWNEKSKIKPFRKNFSKMVNQSNSTKFLHAVDCALDEALRRIEFGLSCSCLSKEVYEKIKSQTLVNAGIKKEDSRINGGDRFSTVATFKPANVVQSVQDLAREQFDGFNKLQVLSLNTQLCSYYRWKGYHQFSTRYFLDGLDEKVEENCSEIPLIAKPSSSDEKVSSKKRKLKDKKIVKDEKQKPASKHKHKRMRNGNGDGDMIPKKKLTKDGGKKSRNGIADRKPSAPIPIPTPKRLFGVGDSICRIAKKLSLSPLIPIPKKESESESQFQSQVSKDSDSDSDSDSNSNSNTVDEKRVDQTQESTKSDDVSTKSEISDSSLKTTSKEKFAALILKFTNLDSIPSVTNLNEIFRVYGSLMESETEVLKKSSCAKVVFEEKTNAEAAFSSAGKFGIFGPSLISYRLDYSPTPRKIYTRKGKKKNGKGNSV
ncbi:unnamed protein product [Lactuca saligna]|uniref:PWWP domain-containing protein n=1 Tax=Lactuca saligna TaxID=75948 RepID=A0AA35ZBT0_LACSI|nr:unnamed protein product [Lactuca saligna]